MTQYQFRVDGRPAGKARDRWRSAAQDAVSAGYGLWADDGVKLNAGQGAEIHVVGGISGPRCLECGIRDPHRPFPVCTRPTCPGTATERIKAYAHDVEQVQREGSPTAAKTLDQLLVRDVMSWPAYIGMAVVVAIAIAVLGATTASILFGLAVKWLFL